jgi:hypothetical protein
MNITVMVIYFEFASSIIKYYQSFLHQLMHIYFKMIIKIYIETAPTCFGVITIIRERTI